jgi:hypothetical protein
MSFSLTNWAQLFLKNIQAKLFLKDSLLLATRTKSRGRFVEHLSRTRVTQQSVTIFNAMTVTNKAAPKDELLFKKVASLLSLYASFPS